jgi:hypothetical protein
VNEPDHTPTVTTLGELMSGPPSDEDPTPVVGDDVGLLEDDDYLLTPPRRWNRLTVALVAALIFVCGFIVGVLAARLTGGPVR